MEIQSNKEYQDWLNALKTKVSVSRVKAALAANKELIHFYFDLGKMITEQQLKAAWGDKLLGQLSKDLNTAFPDMKGFSVTNLKYCRQFYQFYKDEIAQQTLGQSEQFDFGQHAVDQLPWGHNVLIFTKSKNLSEFALRDINKPMGVSEFKLTEILPEDLKSSLPTVEEIEQTLKQSNYE